MSLINDAPNRATDIQFVDVQALSARTGISVSTLHRYRRDGKIPFYQPGGKGSRLLFPLDAIEKACSVNPDQNSAAAVPPCDPLAHLAGPLPIWMKSTPNTK